jgi:hypothetical protein
MRKRRVISTHMLEIDIVEQSPFVVVGIVHGGKVDDRVTASDGPLVRVKISRVEGLIRVSRLVP